MNQLSTGEDSTLENWIRLSSAVFGEDSKPTLFLKNKAAASPKGIKEEVLADERQLLFVLMKMYTERTTFHYIYYKEIKTMTMKFYKVKEGTSYHKALLQSIKDESKMLEINEQVRKEFGLAESTQYSLSPDRFFQEEITEEQSKWFKKDGEAKKNSTVFKRYKELMKDNHMDNYEHEGIINFTYGIMKRRHSETMMRMKYHNNFYIQTDTYFGEEEMKYLEEITEIQYTETRLAALEERKNKC